MLTRTWFSPQAQAYWQCTGPTDNKKCGQPVTVDRQILFMVGATGLEPATPCSQSRCATKLRHAPQATCVIARSLLAQLAKKVYASSGHVLPKYGFLPIVTSCPLRSFCSAASTALRQRHLLPSATGARFSSGSSSFSFPIFYKAVAAFPGSCGLLHVNIFLRGRNRV